MRHPYPFFQTELNKIGLNFTLRFPAHVTDKWGATVKVKQESYFQNLFPKLKDSRSWFYLSAEDGVGHSQSTTTCGNTVFSIFPMTM